MLKDPDNIAANHLFAQYWNQYERLVHRVIRQTCGSVDEDTLQVARITLWECIHKYDPSRGVAFYAYLWSMLTFKLREWIACSFLPLAVPPGTLYRCPDKIRFRTVSLDLAGGIQSDERGCSPSAGMLYECAEYQEVENRIDRQLLVERLSRILTERQWHCVCLYFGLFDDEDRTIRDIAKMLGVSHNAVHCSIKLALDRIRQDEKTVRMLKGVLK